MTLQSLAFHRIMKEVQLEPVSKQLVVISTKVNSLKDFSLLQKSMVALVSKCETTCSAKVSGPGIIKFLDDIVLIKFPSAVKNLHFDLIDGMQILGVEEPGNYAETVTLTNIPRYITEIWFDFEYLDTVKGNKFVTLRHPVFKNLILENGIDPVGNWFDATTMTVNIY